MGQHGILKVVKICRIVRIKLNQLVYENVRNVRIITILLRKWYVTITNILSACSWRKKTAGIDRYGMKKLRHCHTTYEVMFFIIDITAVDCKLAFNVINVNIYTYI